jgi:hypothetical protein
MVIAALLALDAAAYFLGFDSRELGALRRGERPPRDAGGAEFRRGGAIRS